MRDLRACRKIINMFIRDFLEKNYITNFRETLSLIILFLILTIPALYSGGRAETAKTWIILASGILLLLGAFAMIFRRKKETIKKLSLRHPIIIPFALIFLAKWVSLIFSIEYYTSFFDFFLFVSYFVILIEYIRISKKTNALQILVYLSVAFLFILSIIGFIFFLSSDWQKLVSTFYWHNQFEGFSALFIPFLLITFLTAKTRLSVFLLGMASTVIFCATYFTYSKGILASLILILPFFIYAFKKEIAKSLSKRIIPLIVIFIISVILITFIKSTPSKAPEINSTQEQATALLSKIKDPADLNENIDNSNIAENTAQFRLKIWLKTIDMFLEDPLIGVGSGNFKRVYLKHADSPQYYSSYAHNLYLETIVELGLLGICALLIWIFFTLIVSAKNAFSKSSASPAKKALFFGIVIFFLHNGVDLDWQYPSIMLVVLLFVAYINKDSFSDGELNKKHLKKMPILMIGSIILPVLLVSFAALNLISIHYENKAALERSIYHFPESLKYSLESYNANPLDFNRLNFVAYDNFGAGISETKNSEKRKQYLDEAEKRAKETIALAPHYSSAYLLLGNIYMSKAEPEKALESYLQAIALNPFYRNAYIRAGKIMLEQKKYTEAIEFLEKPLAIYTPSFFSEGINFDDFAPGAKEISAKLYNIRGVAYAEIGEYGGALKDFDTALFLYPDFKYPKTNLDLIENRGEEKSALPFEF